jgi:hypothetical protein
VCSTLLQQPVRLVSLALGCALATATLVLVTFLASNLVLSVIGGIGQVAAAPDAPADQPAAAVLLSAEPEDETERRCERRARGVEQQRSSDHGRCAGQRTNGGTHRP